MTRNATARCARRTHWRLLAVTGVAVAVLLGGLLLVRTFVRTTVRDALAYALVYDLVEYAAAHNGQLPRSWDEFVRWGGAGDHVCRWDTASLDRRFSLQWGRRADTPTNSQLIETRDPALKAVEADLNATLLRLLSAAEHARHGPGGADETQRGGQP